jgi:hypothetical protein
MMRTRKEQKMKARILAISGLVAASGGAVVLLRRKMDPRRIHSEGDTDGRADRRTDRWHVVTVNRSPEEVWSDGQLPDPLAELGDDIEVQVRPAPGDRGTEIAARLRGPVPSGLSGAAARISGDDPRQSVREALRKAKSLLETGEVLRPDEPSTTEPTPGGKLLGLVTSRSRGEGRL